MPRIIVFVSLTIFSVFWPASSCAYLCASSRSMPLASSLPSSPTCYSIEITVGVAFKNDTLGWTSKASGSSYPQIVRTEDGGSTWTPINQTGTFSIVTAIAASRGQDIDVQVFGVPVSFQVQRKMRSRSMFDSRVSFKT